MADIRAIVAAFVALAVAFSFATPPFEGPDEIAHFAYAKSLADGRGFPQPPISIADGEPAQESTQPPLYYLIAAGAIRVIAPNSADFVSLLRRNRSSPTVTAETANDNKNVFVPVSERTFPPRDTALAIQVARLVSIAFGAVAVLAVYGIGREYDPERRSLALVAAAIAAFTPQFIFVSAAVSNDSSAVATCSVAIWCALRIARRGLSFPRASGLGVAIGLAALSKASALTLGPLAAGLIALLEWKRGAPAARRSGLAQLAICALIASALAGPWYLRLYREFGDALGIAPHLAMGWARTQIPTFEQALAETLNALNTYWLAFGWGIIMLPDAAYLILNGLAFAGLGAAAWALRSQYDPTARAAGIFAFVWLAATAIALLRWNQLVHAALGRLLFPALPAVSLLLAVGWRAIGSRFLGSPAALIRSLPATALFSLSVFSLVFVLGPAFRPPSALDDAAFARQPGLTANIRQGDIARLIRVSIPADARPLPGQKTPITVCWEALRRDPRELLVFVQIVGEGDRIFGARRSHPGLGRYPTAVWDPGARFCDEMLVPIESNTPAPEVYRVEVGLFDFPTLERMPALASDGAPIGSNFVGLIKVAPGAYRAPPIENPLAIGVGGQIQLAGYAIVRNDAGKPATLRTYWRALSRPGADYTMFVHLRNAANQVVAQSDGPPRGGAYPTRFWDAGEIIIDERPIELPRDLAAAGLRIVIGMYEPRSGERLPVSGNLDGEITLPGPPANQ